MKKIATLVFLFIGMTCKSQSLGTNTVNDKAQVYFMRSTGMQYSGNGFSIFIDDTVVCHLNNKRFSLHDVSPGVHQVSVRVAGNKVKDKDAKTAVILEAGKTYYLKIVLNVGFFSGGLYAQELTEDEGKKMLGPLKQDTKCF